MRARLRATALMAAARDCRAGRLPLAALALLLLALSLRPAARATGAPDVAAGKPAGCALSPDAFDASRDAHAFEEYDDFISQLLQHKEFRLLDCLADEARASKARFPGGQWKLRVLYDGLSKPRLHPTDVDWKDQLQLLQRWAAARPRSITPRVALAEAYINYARAARGDDEDEVTDTGWKLYRERLKKSETTLQQASALRAKCPEWYYAMQLVAGEQGWSRDRAEQLVKRAVAFEPDYDVYYRTHFAFLLPRHHGRDGDSEQFAQQSADQRGGAAGDILYFQVAKEMVCICDDPQFLHFSWPRVQNGFEELGKRYGQSIFNLNSYALMALTKNDMVLADRIFKQIGENWDKQVWNSQECFRDKKQMAALAAPEQAHSRAIEKTADLNMQSPEGVSYTKLAGLKVSGFVKFCHGAAVGYPAKFDLLIQVSEDGSLQDAWTTVPTPPAACIFSELRAARARNETLFPPPPSPGYWVKISMDPATFDTAAQ